MISNRGILGILLVVGLLCAAIVGTTTMLAGSGDQENVSFQSPAPSGREATSVASLADAEAVLGTRIPIPAYLPSGYQIRKVLVGGTTNIALLFSDEEITPNMQPYLSGGLWESEFKRPGGARLVLDVQKVGRVANPDFWDDFEAGRTYLPGQVVDLGYVKGRLVDTAIIIPPSHSEDIPGFEAEHEIDNIWYLEWSHSAFMFTLKAPKDLSKEEVLRIASSVPVLVSSLDEVSVEEAQSILGVSIPTLD